MAMTLDLLQSRYGLFGHSPDKAAFVRDGETSLSYGQLEQTSFALSDWLTRQGLKVGDHIAYMMENCCALAIVYWAAQRAGLYYTPIPIHAKADEVHYLVQDSGARIVLISSHVADQWSGMLAALGGSVRVVAIDADVPQPLETVDLMTLTPGDPPMSQEISGFPMLYSSGTTGRPKGIIRPLTGQAFGTAPIAAIYRDYHGMNADTVFLSPAPLYHAAPLRALLAVNQLGGTAIAMARFDPVRMLELVDRHRVTHLQLVPTMMRRLLEVPPDIRASFDLGSLRCVIHAAAPCPPDVKRAMIDWLGPIISEYYGATEGAGMTYIDSPQWLAHPGSVGRAILGELHICNEAGEELPTGEAGLVCFAGGPAFAYYNAPEKLAECRTPQGWITLGDIGFVDADGFLFLRDRRSFIINSGGVNIYPAEVENVIAGHPMVRDVAVIGVPDADLGEATKAIVEPVEMPEDAGQLAAEIIAYTKARLSSVKAPKSVDFEASLPRNESGKILKAQLKSRYWQV
jgi:long-chain acyl-CoA synthetase